MITACKAYITNNGVNSIWDQPQKVVVDKIKAAIHLNQVSDGREMSDHKIFSKWTVSRMWWLQMCPPGVPAVFPHDQREARADSQRKAVWLQRDVHFWKVWHIPASAQQDLGDVQHHHHVLCPTRLEDRRPRNHGHKVSSRCSVTGTGLHSWFSCFQKCNLLGNCS